MSEHVRYWDHISPTSQTRLADDVVDAILRDVFQGKKDHLREHGRAVAYKAVRGHEWPYFEECVEKAVAERLDATRRETLLAAAEAYSDFEVYLDTDGERSMCKHGLTTPEWLRKHAEEQP